MTEESSSKIVHIKDVFYANLDDWPSEPLKKSLFRLRPEEGAEVYLNLSEGYHDITKNNLDLEKRFRPKVTLRTKELKTELDRWNIGGGSFFRIIADAPDTEKAMRVCIQYFIIWTRQLFPFQIWFLSVPFFLATLFLWRFSFKYVPGPTAPFGTYLTLLLVGLGFILLGIWTVFEGIIKRTFRGIKSWKTVPDSMIGFVFPGILFWTTALEYAIIALTGNSKNVALIPISAWLSLALGIVVLLIWADFYLRGEKSYVEKFSHPMDYAPLLLFLEKDSTGNWAIEGAQFDFFHYKTIFVPKEKLIFKEDDKAKEHPWFLIDRSWHAFREYLKPNITERILSNLILDIILLIIILGIYIIYILDVQGVYTFYLTNAEILTGYDYERYIQLIIYIFLPMILVLMVWSISRTREYEFKLWEELSHKSSEELLKNHYMTYDRLRILWNLRNREHLGEQRITSLWSKSTWIEGDSSRLIARVKLQYPFDRYKDWKTLRDTQEELLSLIAIHTKEEELKVLQKEIAKAKSELQRQMLDDVKNINKQLSEEENEIEKKVESIFQKSEQ